MRGGLLITHQCKGCWLSLGEVEVVFDLFVLPLEVFDVILGMDWLIAFQAKIDCYCHRVVFTTPEGRLHTLKGEWDSAASRAGPYFGEKGVVTHTLSTLIFS